MVFVFSNKSSRKEVDYYNFGLFSVFNTFLSSWSSPAVIWLSCRLSRLLPYPFALGEDSILTSVGDWNFEDVWTDFKYGKVFGL